MTTQASIKQHLDNCRSEYGIADGDIEANMIAFVKAVSARKQAFEEQISKLEGERHSSSTQL